MSARTSANEMKQFYGVRPMLRSKAVAKRKLGFNKAMPGDRNTKRYDAHMAEYKALRGEVVLYSQRIDRTIGIYLSVLFGLFGYLLRPDSGFEIQVYLARINEMPTQLGILLLVAILNSLVMIRIQSFYLAVLALSQYTATVLRPSVAALLNDQNVLAWDEPDIVRGKRYWLPVRSVAQVGFGLLGLAISLSVLIVTWSIAFTEIALTILALILCANLLYWTYTSTRIWIVGRNFHETPTTPTMPKPEKDGRSL